MIKKIYNEELKGREFDWCAIDVSGNIGMFSTAGSGFIPKSVINQYQSYNAIFENIPSPSYGTLKFFSDFSKLGFYVFDWDLNYGPYKKVESPQTDIDQALRQKIFNISGLITLNLSFSEAYEISDELLLKCE